MALFNKFFFSSSNKKKSNTNLNQINSSPHFSFDSNQVRILLYRECDASGRRLLFDSSSIQKISINGNQKQNTRSNLQASKNKLVDNLQNQTTTKNNPLLNDSNFIEISNGIGYRHVRPTANDITNIGEMVFGALAMSFRSPSLKIHWLQAPSRLLCSQVFLSPVSGKNTGCLLNQTGLLGSAANSNNNLSPKQKLQKQSSETFDGYSVNSFSSPFSPLETNNRSLSVQLSALPVINDTNFMKNPLNLQCDQIGLSKMTTTQSLDETTTTPTIGSDSGYAATISDCWTSRSSYQYSTRSSMGSVLSDPLSTYDSLRKFSIESGKSNYGDGCGGAINSSFGSTSFSMSMQQNPKINDMGISRRVIRNFQTSFENRHSICDFVGFISDNYQQTATTSGGSDGCVTSKYNIQRSIDLNESQSNPEIRKKDVNSSSNNICNLFEMNKTSLNKCHKMNSKRSKLGLAVCISMSESNEKEMEEFCCEHIALLESMLFRLRASVEFAYLNHKKFLKIMLHAWQKTVEWILDFFTVPRLTSPIWFNLTFLENKTSKHTADHFIKEFCWLLKTSDAKDTNFFVSTMITAVLTHHLGWVSTVSSTPLYATDTVNELANDKQKNLNDVANQYPYNPLWAQMCDLYGAIGHPPKVSRTIICGKDKNLIEKFLHVLTYFIRCGEIHRKDIKKDMNIENVNQMSPENDKKLDKNDEKQKKISGLGRTNTIHTKLCEFTGKSDSEIKNQEVNNLPSNKLISYDSKFVKRRLQLNKFNNDIVCKNFESKEKIKFTVTTPEDIEMVLDDETFSIYTNSTTVTDDCEALEAIEIQDSSEINFISRLDLPDFNEKVSFWKFDPIVKEGISWLDMMKFQKGVKVSKCQNDKANKHLLTENNVNYGYGKASRPQDNIISLSDLITENSVGKSERFVWGIEPVKENVCLEEEKHFEISRKLIEKDRNFLNAKNEIVNQEKGKGVLFVLGDNEHLVNIKKNDETLSTKEEMPKNELIFAGNHSNKKQSGVKFNLEEYSESVTSFLSKKSNFESKLKFNNIQPLKNPKIEKLPLNYDFWTKCTCDSNVDITSTSSSSIDLNKHNLESDLKNQKISLNSCEYCKSNTAGEIKLYEKKLLHNEAINDVNVKKQIPPITTCGGNTGAYRKTAPASGNSPIKKIEFKDENINCLPISSRGLQLKKMFQNLKEKNKKFESTNIKNLPMPDVTIPNENLQPSFINKDKSNIKTGFIPSLFVGVNDRYISDMVLQGTISPFSKWETNVKNDLTISSHCASLISQPTENIAIIADMDKWEIKILSSQNNILPYTSSSNGPVGMSQLVSQFLEGLYIMSNSGISSYDCLAYLESKLKEIYLQSEALAGLLLTTEFCSLNSVTTALNLSENDVPLLLAIASIHSPQVTKRYGISFG